MSITKILLEWSSDQEKRIEKEGQYIVDSAEVGDYEIILMATKNPDHPMVKILGTQYDLGFQRKGRDFTNMDQLLGKEVITRDGIDLKTFREIDRIIREWVDKYGEIVVASTNQRKNRIYQRIFKKLDYNTRVKFHLSQSFLTIS